MAIPKNISLKHCLEALKKIDSGYLPSHQDSTAYSLFYGTKEYPPKLVLRLANLYANGEELWSHYAGENTNEYLKKLGFSIGLKGSSPIPFFTCDEIQAFANIINLKSSDDKELFSTYGEYLSKTIFLKTNYWLNQLMTEKFEIIEDWRWTRGYGVISHYSWGRIFKKNDIDKKVFFTIGADAKQGALIYKLDCMHNNKNNSLSSDQVQRYNDYVYGKMGLNWQFIDQSEINNYNWEKLVSETKAFISKNLKIYDEVIDIIWNNKKITDIPNLLVQQKPEVKVSERKNEVDYDSMNKLKKMYGDIGEEMVLNYEKNYLLSHNRIDLAEKVIKVNDKMGFDILSFNPDNDEEKFIEVKATVSDFSEPFFLTENEYCKYQKYLNKYYIYRIYCMNIQKKSGYFYQIHKNLDEIFNQEVAVYKFSPAMQMDSLSIL